MDQDVFMLTVDVEQVAPVFTEDADSSDPGLAETPQDSFTQDPAVDDLPQDALLGDYLLDYSGESLMTGVLSNELPTVSDLIGAGALPEEIQNLVDMQMVLPDHPAVI